MSRLNARALRRALKVKNIHNYYFVDISGSEKPELIRARGRKPLQEYIRSIALPLNAPCAEPLTLPTPLATSLPRPVKNGLYARPLSRPDNPDLFVREITDKMYVPNSMHLRRRQQLRKSISQETINIGRTFMNHITTVWGDRTLRSLELDEVMNYLFSVNRSGSWKNTYICALNEIYREGQFMGCKLVKPHFPKITREQKKADIFTESELETFFQPDNFSHDFYLFFLTSLSGGLRLGEARGLKVKQIIFEKKAVIIDGFMKDDNKTRTNYNKKGSPEHPKLRVIPYPDVTMALLKQHIERNCAKDDDFIFTHKDLPVSKSLGERAFIGALIKAGITWDKETLIRKGYWRDGHIQIKRDLIPDGRKLVPHSLRYTYITRMSRNLDARNLLKLTGHDSTAMVDYYNRRNLEIALSEIPDVDAAISALIPWTI